LVSVLGSPLVAVPNQPSTACPRCGPPAIVGKTLAFVSGVEASIGDDQCSAPSELVKR